MRIQTIAYTLYSTKAIRVVWIAFFTGSWLRVLIDYADNSPFPNSQAGAAIRAIGCASN